MWSWETAECCLEAQGREVVNVRKGRRSDEVSADSDSDGHLSADHCPKEEYEQRTEIVQKWNFFREDAA